MEAPKERHSVSLKVLRLSRPTFHAHQRLPESSVDTESPIDPDAALKQGIIKRGNDFLFQPLLKLPPAFGSAYVGETFSCTLCANNELLDDSDRLISSVRINAEIQAPTQTVPLDLSPSDGEQSGLKSGESLQKIIRFDLKEEGNHILAVSLEYMEMAAKKDVEPTRRTRTFRKLYQFVAAPCLSVRTKVSDFPLQGFENEKRSSAKPMSFVLEAQLENMADGPITLVKIVFSPKAAFNTTSMNWEASGLGGDRIECPFLAPRDITQAAFLLKQKPNSKAETTKDGRVILGQLVIRWRTSMGVDSEQLSWGSTSNAEETAQDSPQLPVEQTIEEERISESENERPEVTPRTPRHLKRNSYQRLSRLSDEARLSIASISLSPDRKGTDSNRSSITIKGFQINGNTTTLSDVDFDRALRRFATERDSFLTDLNLSAGAVVPNRPKARPKTQRIVNNEDGGGLKSGVGSIRPSLRTSRRLSNYNSVIPNPQPLPQEDNTHPLKRRFEPVLLDRYPPKSMLEETTRRGYFPDYVPMFAFPNDVHVVSADERPRSTWHGFAMTTGDNSRLYGICIIIWMPLNHEASQELERKCEEWRRDNMTDEERELASSLGERLAVERVKLSRLLAMLPTVASGSQARENLEDEISAVEEKIGLMADLLRPVRHGAAAKIDGLTNGETGLWIPRSYGILGRDPSLTSFWKEWLRAVVVPMTNGGILRVPPTSPKVGMWQPLERYVVNLCAEALSPISSKTQVELSIRELRLFARKEAVNELPGSRNTDLYALFRALSIPNVVVLMEFVLAEARIILLSSHTSMLHLASKAIAELLYPLTWSGIFIPVLPVRLIQALEAPCPYIVGIERRYERIELPEDDFVLVDLDEDEIESNIQPIPMPRQVRRKLTSLLQMAAPHHNRYGVSHGPPAYAIETFPFDAFSSENPGVFTGSAVPSALAKFANLNSASFGDNASNFAARPPVFNAFLPFKSDPRPSTSSTTTPPSPRLSPTSGSFSALPLTPISRNDSGFAIQSSLREKRSGNFETSSKRSSTYVDRVPTLRRPSIFNGHTSSHSSSRSIATISTGNHNMSNYAPSTYAQSTLAASTIMPNVLLQPVRNTETMTWIEGHCLNWRANDDRSVCSVCVDKAEDGIYKCSGCGINAHARCAQHICLVCAAAFHSEQVRAAFVRCFASLFYTYRKFLVPAAGDQRRAGMLFNFNMNGFLRSLPHETADYMGVLQQTQAFNEFIHERELKAANDPSIMLFDQIILSKRNRGRTSIFNKSKTDFLSDTSDHLYRSAAATPPQGKFPGDYTSTVTRTPAKLSPSLLKEPRYVRTQSKDRGTRSITTFMI
ncbi:MAG: hypothetical protein Q9173_002163 [Seirophora scorigena]